MCGEGVSDVQAVMMTSDMHNMLHLPPSSFFTAALQQSRVHLTWDETDHSRLQATMRKLVDQSDCLPVTTP